MHPEEYVAFDGTGLAELVRRGEVTPLALAEAAIERIESLNGTLNAVVERCYAEACAAARVAGAEAPFCGVPFLAKDVNIEVAGLPLTFSCRWLKDLPPAQVDSPLAARWRAAGLTILGRSNTPEFAGEFVTEPTWRGPTRNPWSLARSPGGSSGGAAAAVASGMVPIAHGTDSGGSIRVPAAACGLVGLKPSRGWVPVGPRHDELAGGLDCEHVLTRTVRDCARMLEVTSGAESTTRTPLRPAVGSFARALEEPLPALRVGVALEAPGGLEPIDEIGKAVEEIADLLARSGHRVRPVALPASANIGEPAGILWLTAIAEDIDFYRERIGRSPNADELEALTRAAIALGQRSTAIDYVRARRALCAATRDMAEKLADLDVLLLPTTADHAPRIGEIDGRTAAFDFDRWNADSYGYAPYTELFNVTGQPAISLPLAVSREGLPIGIQFAAPLGEDARLIRLAVWLERERPWAGRLAELRRRFL
ncbi:MAG TPA: amidase [Steroidobacteraceae bacterium]|nr:amidase [Steroidobacteraceae bacterium]